MHKRAARLILAALALLVHATMANAHSDQGEGPMGLGGGWKLVFSDDFDGSSLDRGRWTTCYWWDRGGCTNLGNRELQWYKPENVSVRDGRLNLIAQEQQVRGHEGRRFDYTSGMVTTGRYYSESSRRTRFATEYGFFEMRAKVPSGRGLWSAFWLMPATLREKPEIDIMEIIGQRPNVLEMHVHYEGGFGQNLKQNHRVKTSDLSADWHVYGVHWSPDAIVWYLDGKPLWRVTDPSAIPREPMYMLINLAVGGNWPGNPDRNTEFPAVLGVDYVRVWKEVDG